MGVRLAVSALCAGMDGSYPDTAWDCAVVDLRSSEGGLLPPCWKTYSVTRHEKCRNAAAHDRNS
jgi:hypothetical protein